MRIAQCTPGVGDNTACENCLRDVALVGVFEKLGHEVLTIPLYLPVGADRAGKFNTSPIFFGGVNVYLQQKSGVFRKTPRWLDRLFDNQKLLEWSSRRFQMVDARILSQTTVSMLKGRDGYQVKEFDRLTGWLNKEENRPDVVYLSNGLLAGLAKPIKEVLNVPVVCLLQGEDKFLNDLLPPYDEQAWDILAECAGDIDAFIAIGENYGEVMKKTLNISQEKMHIVCRDDTDAQQGVTCNIGKLADEVSTVFTRILNNLNEGDYA